jgi:hypothetical protein
MLVDKKCEEIFNVSNLNKIKFIISMKDDRIYTLIYMHLYNLFFDFESNI